METFEQMIAGEELAELKVAASELIERQTSPLIEPGDELFGTDRFGNEIGIAYGDRGFEARIGISINGQPFLMHIDSAEKVGNWFLERAAKARAAGHLD